MPQHKVIICLRSYRVDPHPSMSPHLPVTPAEIADAALGAAAAEPPSCTCHARNPDDGRPDQSPEAFEPFLPVIKQSSNVVVNLTTGGSPYMTVEERVRPAATWKPEVASLNMGSMNFGLFPMLKRYKSFKHDWEPQMLEGSPRSRLPQLVQGYPLRAGDAEQLGRTLRNSNATTPATSTTCIISGPKAWSKPRCSSRPASDFSAASARIPMMSCT